MTTPLTTTGGGGQAPRIHGTNISKETDTSSVPLLVSKQAKQSKKQLEKQSEEQASISTMDTRGGALNPIVVTDSPPPPPRRRSSKTVKHSRSCSRSRSRSRSCRPHSPSERCNRPDGGTTAAAATAAAVHGHRLSRQVLAPKSNNTNISNHHRHHQSHDHNQSQSQNRSHDLHRSTKMAKKLPTAQNHVPTVSVGNVKPLSFEEQYPISTRFLAQQKQQKQQQQQQHSISTHPLPPRQAQMYHFSLPESTSLTPPPPPPSPAVHKEDDLRRRAVQSVREYARPLAQKRKLSELSALSEQDVDKTQARNVAAIAHTALVRPRSSSGFSTTASSLHSQLQSCSNRPPSVLPFKHPSFSVHQLVEQTALLTSLLRIYPQARNQQGLREDIAKLVSVYNQQMTAWMETESTLARNLARKLATSSTNQAAGADKHTSKAATEHETCEDMCRHDRDNKLRQFFSAEATMWQDGSGQSVADVYAPAPSSNTMLATGKSRMSTPSVKTERRVQGTGSTHTTTAEPVELDTLG